tara:strand:+ start:369 stop:572 length:204 start_codon:yes stop_codon:yes gene_type:complete
VISIKAHIELIGEYDVDTVIESEREEMGRIAASGDESPVLMINQNRYTGDAFPDGALYQRWRAVNKK